MTRVGFGFDVHRLVEGRALWLGGVNIPWEKGLLEHSDADVAIHALCDALLGAASVTISLTPTLNTRASTAVCCCAM